VTLAGGTILAVENLSVAFHLKEGLVYANKEISFLHSSGEWLGLMGPSGSGKTVLARAISGLLTGIPGVVQGRILYRDNNLLHGLDEMVFKEKRNGSVVIKKNAYAWTKRHRENIARHSRNEFAYVFQSPFDALNPYFTVGQHMKEAFLAGGIPAAEIPAQGRELLASLRMSEPDRVLKSHPHELSGGMAQRVVIAMALAQRASYLIADECTTSLDPEATHSTIEALQKAREVNGCSILFITHERDLASAYCDRILRMHNGTVVYD
jgi:ABC-type glutathione transport system ATPase component